MTVTEFYTFHENLPDNIYKIAKHEKGYELAAYWERFGNWSEPSLNTYCTFEQTLEHCKSNPFNRVAYDLESILALRELIS